MGINSAFALSQAGLSTVEKWSEITSANIANADRAGYAKKTVLRETSADGAVAVAGIRRESDLIIDRQHRAEISRFERQDAIASGISLYTNRLGTSDAPNALNARIAALETALVQLAAAPEQSARQSAVVLAAEDMAREVNTAASAISEAKFTTEQAIEVSVGKFNQSLARIADLNEKIIRLEPGTHRHAAMTDEINASLDNLSKLADIHVRFDAAGRATVYTAGGTPVVEGDSFRAAEFEPASASLLVEGIDITPGVSSSRGFYEGRLAGQFSILRQELPQMERQLDELARGLIVGFEAADGSLVPGAAGLFTDNGGPFDALSLSGLAHRIAVNDAVRPELGGDLWRVRDGIGAAAEGPPSDNAQVATFVAMLEAYQTFDPTAGLGTNRTIGDFAGALVADQQYVRVEAEGLRDGFKASANAIGATRSSISGVNTDEELQQLIEIEQSYAANSQVMRVLSEMVDTLLASF